MTSTALQIITAREAPEIAHVLYIEGFPYSIVDGSQAQADEIVEAQTALAVLASFDSSPAVLDVGNAVVSERLELFRPSIGVSTVEVDLHLTDSPVIGASVVTPLIALLMGQGLTTAKTAPIAADVTPTATTITVEPRVAFPASGLIYLGAETILYSGTTTSGGLTTAFTGCTRGYCSEHIQTSGWSYYHRLDPKTATAPMVSTVPRSGAIGRMAALHLVARHGEYSPAQWTVGDDAIVMAKGRIVSCVPRGATGRLTLRIEQAPAALCREVFGQPWEGDLARGLYFAEGMAAIAIQEEYLDTSGTRVNNTYCTTLSGTSQRQGWDSVAGQKGILALLDEKLQALASAASIKAHWDVSLMPETDWERVAVHASTEGTTWATPSATSHVEMAIGLHPAIWQLLGWPYDGRMSRVTDTGGTTHSVVWRKLERGAWSSSGSAVYEHSLQAPDPPIDYFAGGTRVTSAGEVTHYLDLEEPEGTWVSQPVMPTGYDVPAAATGFVMLGDAAVWAASLSGTRLTLHRDMTRHFQGWGFSGTGGIPTEAIVRRGQPGRLHVKQIWFERGPLADILRRMIYSTGASTYNTADDLNPGSMGAAIPAGMVDDDSIALLGDRSATILLTKGEKLDKILTSACALVGAHFSWSIASGKIVVVRPRLTGTTAAAAASYALTEANKCEAEDRPDVEYGTDGMINVLVLRSGRGLDGRYQHTTTIEGAASLSDFPGMRRTATMEGLVVGPDESEIQAWVESVSGEILTLMSRPRYTVARTVNFTLLGLSVGDVTTLTDETVYDPRTGTIGTTALPCVVTAVSWSLRTLKGQVVVATVPELAFDRLVQAGPSAEVTYGAGGYVVVSGSSRYLQCEAHTFSHSDESVDVSHFAAGDKIDIYLRSPTAPGSPGGWTAQTIDSVDSANSRIYLTATLAGFSSTSRYIVGFSTVASTVAGQRDVAFIADDATNSIGVANDDALQWGPSPPYPGALGAVTYTEEYTRPATIVTTAGMPVSAGVLSDFARSHNVILGYCLRSVVAQECWTTYRNLFTLYGPVWVPLFHHGSRSLVGRLLIGSGSGTKTYKVRISPSCPRRSLGTALSWTGPYAEASVSTSSAGPVWSDEFSINPQGYTTPGDLPGVWLTVMTADASNRRLYGLSIVEGAIA